MPTNIALLSPSHSPDASNLSDAATARDAISVLTFSIVGLVTELLAILGSNGDGWATSLSSGLIAGAPPLAAVIALRVAGTRPLRHRRHSLQS